MNAFVFANTQDPTQQVNGVNQAFLPLEGRPLLIYVLMALDRVTQIDKVVVIGSPKEIMRAIESVIFEIPFQKKIIVLEEKENFLESVRFADAETHKKTDRQEGLGMISEPTLFLPGNIPFVTTAEISTFIAASDMDKADCYLSIVPGGTARFPGIKQEEINLNETEIQAPRLGRLMLAHCDAMENADAIETIASHYKETQLEKTSQTTPLKAFLRCIQANPQTKSPDTPASLSEIEKEVGHFLKTRFKFTETATAGNALPAEDLTAYQFLIAHFEDWRKHIMTLKTEEGDKICSISGSACGSHDHDV